MGQLGRPKWYGNGPLHDDMFGFGPRKLPFKQKIVGKQPHTIFAELLGGIHLFPRYLVFLLDPMDCRSHSQKFFKVFLPKRTNLTQNLKICVSKKSNQVQKH